MAANLSGMFGQLNQAIAQNPLAGETGNRLIDQLSMNVGGLGSAVGEKLTGQPVDPYSFMTQGGKQQAAQNEMATLDVNTPEGLEQAAQLYSKIGDSKTAGRFQEMASAKRKEAAQKALTQINMGTPEGLMAAAKIYQQTGNAASAAGLVKQANQLAAENQQRNQQQATRERLATGYEDMGMKEQAEIIRAGGTDVEEDAKKLRDLRLIEIGKTRGRKPRLEVAKSLGITEKEFDDMNLGVIGPEGWEDFIQGKRTKATAFTDAQGNPVLLQQQELTGKVLDPKTGKYVTANSLGLQPDVAVSKVIDTASGFVQQLGRDAVADFKELYTAATDATDTLGNIDRNMPLIDNMPTGTFAEARVWAATALDTLGFEQPRAANAQMFVAEAGKRVANEITAFGAGTGLSDKDREFAEKMAGGDISVTPEALKRILQVRRDLAVKTIEQFEKVKSQVIENSSDPNVETFMSIYGLQSPVSTETPVDTPVFNENTMRYFRPNE